MGEEREFEIPNAPATGEGSEEHWLNKELNRDNSNLYRVTLTGDEVEYVARAGVNEAQDEETGEMVPQPWNAIAQCQVTLRARSRDEASKYALRANEDDGYHTVSEVEYVDEDEAE